MEIALPRDASGGDIYSQMKIGSPASSGQKYLGGVARNGRRGQRPLPAWSQVDRLAMGCGQIRLLPRAVKHLHVFRQRRALFDQQPFERFQPGVEIVVTAIQFTVQPVAL